MKNITIVGFALAIAATLTACEKAPVVEDQQKESTTTVSEDLAKEVSGEMKTLVGKFEEGDLSEEDVQKGMMNAIDNSNTMKTELEKQKDEMPKMLIVFKKNRECIIDADSKSDIESCESESISLMKELGIEGFNEEDDTDEELVWNEEEKTKMIQDMDSAIMHTEKMLPCLEKATVITDLMQCAGAINME